uniref:Ribosome biogenesis protein WDR12 homolog n=1 Tax=Chlamydomonas leiostraca TaxID=1034604 RepID=A0A7S0RLG1_9CHLO
MEAHLLQHELSAEALLEVEYVPAVVPPKQQHTAPHDDWVSTVDGSWGGQVVSGSYDGCIRVWEVSGAEASCSATWRAHAGGVNAVACVPAAATASTSGRVVVSAGKDAAVHMWQVGTNGSSQLLASFPGHTDAVQAVAVSPGGEHMVSCGWDGSLKVWRGPGEVVAAAVEAGATTAGAASGASKRRKAGKDGAADAVAVASGPALVQEEARTQLQGHLHTVSCAAFATPGVLFSGGWDHSVRRWDIATGIATDTYNGSKVVCSVACPVSSSGKGAGPGAPGSLVAFGCSDRVLRVWDARARQGEALSVKPLTGHAGWVVGLAWSPSSMHHVASASHDGAIKLWDIRAAVPLATLPGHDDKALCVTWAGDAWRTLVSGGADSKLRTYALETAL